MNITLEAPYVRMLVKNGTVLRLYSPETHLHYDAFISYVVHHGAALDGLFGELQKQASFAQIKSHLLAEIANADNTVLSWILRRTEFGKEPIRRIIRTSAGLSRGVADKLLAGNEYSMLKKFVTTNREEIRAALTRRLLRCGSYGDLAGIIPELSGASHRFAVRYAREFAVAGTKKILGESRDQRQELVT